MYYECWKSQGAKSLTSALRTCPPGTWYNVEQGALGAPCIAVKPYEECLPTCSLTPDSRNYYLILLLSIIINIIIIIFFLIIVYLFIFRA